MTRLRQRRRTSDRTNRRTAPITLPPTSSSSFNGFRSPANKVAHTPVPGVAYPSSPPTAGQRAWSHHTTDRSET